MNDRYSEEPRSQMNRLFRLAAIDACHLLREWSDSDGEITPARIGEFSDQLEQRFAEIYFGTHPRLMEIETRKESEAE